MSAPSTATPQHRNAQTSSTVKGASQPNAPAAAPPQEPPPAREWHEDDFVLALAHLEHLQDVVSSLRTTIPQLVRSLTRKHESPTELYTDFSKEAINGSKKLADLKKLWEGGDMRDIRGKVDTSIRKHGKSIDEIPKECLDGVKEAMTDMPRYGWIEEGEELRGKKRKRDHDEGSDDALDAQQAQRVIDEYRKRHDGIKLEFDKDTRHVTLDVRTADNVDLHFIVSPHTEDEQTTYQVTGPRIADSATKGERKLLQAIRRCLSNRQKPGNLEHTLETLAAYKNLGEARCDVCQRIVDGQMLLPAARRSKRVKTDAGNEVKWVAVHESCLEDRT